jgi:hypothetical protein
MSLAKEFIEARNIKIPTDVKQLTKIMDDYASMMVELEKTALKEMEKEQKIEFAKHFLYKCKDLSILMAYNQVEQELIKYELNQNKTRL